MDARVIERLTFPECFPGNPSAVHIIQTHLSVVCVAGEDVYKLKKPVRLPFADFSTAERREHFCHEELRLNRRLCGDIYRDVVPLFDGPEGVTFRNEGGSIVDHAVHMRRLPQERMMNEVLARNAVSGSEIDAVARIMAAFHRDAARGREVLAAGDPEQLRGYALDNFRDTRAMRGAIFDAELHALLEERTRTDFEALVPKLKTRLSEGRVVDGHGDLHARNICLTDPPTIYDCVEFCAGFRCEDVATENAFLAMDLVYRGHPEFARRYVDAYIEASGDDDQRGLMPALIRYRAMVRAKVSAIAAGEEELPAADREGAAASARAHLNLAAASAIAENGPLLVIACGLPATGKSFVFEALARETSWQCVASDAVRKELAGRPSTSRLPDEFYSVEFSARTYAEVNRRAVAGLRAGPVLVDANFRSAAQRAGAWQEAREAGAAFAVVWFDAGEGMVRDRMGTRTKEAAAVSDADWSVYRDLKAGFESPDAGAEGFPVLAVDGAATREKILSGILSFLMVKGL